MAKDGKKEENQEQYAIEILESKEENLGCRRYRSNREPHQTLILNGAISRATASRPELFLGKVHSFRSTVPKHITTIDEKYILRCLELIHNRALRAAFSFASKVDILPADASSLVEIKNISSINMAGIAVEYPLDTGTEAFLNSTIGTVSGSQSMINILNSPLLQQFGSFKFDANSRKSLRDAVSPVYYDFSDSPQESSGMLCGKPENEAAVLDRKHVTAPLHRRIVSRSSTNSSCSDQSSSSMSASSFQGMMQCSWKNGLPHHVFSVDDKREVYVANFSKLDDKGLGYVYSFHSRKNGKKEGEVREHELECVGKMRVTTSTTLCSDNLEVREMQFVLSVSSENPASEKQTPNHTVKKNRKLTRKVVDVFRTSHSYRHRSSSKFEVSNWNPIFEDSPWEPSENVDNSRLDSVAEDNKNMSNVEMAAIIVKEKCKIRKEVEPGGWGLKFLKKSGKNSCFETMGASKFTRNGGECSTSMNVIVPAGFHGGPRMRVGGPSSLAERWISGGQCDCGGWDLGCPLTILVTKSSETDSSSTHPMDNTCECKSIDLFIQGSKQEVPVMKMVNIHEALYYIHFQSTLSSLQSFAIATAIFHSQSRLLRSKLYRS